jgi:hypothetical protein
MAVTLRWLQCCDDDDGSGLFRFYCCCCGGPWQGERGGNGREMPSEPMSSIIFVFIFILRVQVLSFNQSCKILQKSLSDLATTQL